MNHLRKLMLCAIACMPLLLIGGHVAIADDHDYDALVELFEEWREFERPPLRDGAPDYTAETFDARHDDFLALRDRLHAFETSEWPIEQQVDWHLVRAEMNGYDFNYRVLMPWVRDPAYYQSIWLYRSDVPAHEGPTHHAVTELWTYEFPLSESEGQRLIADLSVIPPLMEQAQQNLTGNARELWIAGIRNIEDQGQALDDLAAEEGLSDELQAAIAEAKASS